MEENKLILKYNTVFPNGLNTKHSIKPTYKQSKYRQATKLPYGVKTPMAMGHCYIKTGFKNISRIYHRKKFKLNNNKQSHASNSTSTNNHTHRNIKLK